MPQSEKGAAANPWLAHVKKCAAEYKKEQEAKAQKKRRLTKKTPEAETVYATPAEAKAPKRRLTKKSPPPAETKVPKRLLKKWSAPP